MAAVTQALNASQQEGLQVIANCLLTEAVATGSPRPPDLPSTIIQQGVDALTKAQMRRLIKTTSL